MIRKKRLRRPSRVLSIEDIQKILNVAETLREKILISLFANTGLRESDIAKLHTDEIDFTNERLLIKQKKTGEMAYPQIPSSLVQEMRMYLRDVLKTKKGFLFPSSRKKGKSLSERQIYNIFIALAKKAGFKEGSATPHDMKSSFITRAGEKGVPLGIVSYTTGTSIQTAKKHYEKPTPKEVQKMYNEKGVFIE